MPKAQPMRPKRARPHSFPTWAGGDLAYWWKLKCWVFPASGLAFPVVSARCAFCQFQHRPNNRRPTILGYVVRAFFLLSWSSAFSSSRSAIWPSAWCLFGQFSTVPSWAFDTESHDGTFKKKGLPLTQIVLQEVFSSVFQPCVFNWSCAFTCPIFVVSKCMYFWQVGSFAFLSPWKSSILACYLKFKSFYYQYIALF